MKYVALLRGINVGGKHSLPMAKVKATFEAAGAANVATYIQSGNVVFTAKSASADKLAAALTKTAGFAVPVVLRTEAEIAAVIADNPYPKSETVHCAFLPAAIAKPALAKIEAFDAKPCLPSTFQLASREIYFDLPAGIGRDKLVGTILRAVPDATVRNWRTVGKLAGMVAEL
jgi:uncharacterized protein (DUF1697 family)